MFCKFEYILINTTITCRMKIVISSFTKDEFFSFSNQVMRKKLILFFKRRNHARKQRVSAPVVGKVWLKFQVFVSAPWTPQNWHTDFHGQYNSHIIPDESEEIRIVGALLSSLFTKSYRILSLSGYHSIV